MISAWARDRKPVPGQRKVEDKSNEITTIPEFLAFPNFWHSRISGIPELPALLTIKGAIVTIDAMGCRRGICRRIIDREADYLIGPKGSQGCSRGDVELFLDGHLERGTGDDCIRQGETIAGDHGRIETRRHTVRTKTGWLGDRRH